MACTTQEELTAPFNTDSRVAAVTGLMFEIQAKSNALTIRTLELDTKLGSANGNLAVEVWQSSRSVALAYSDPSAWGQVALTRLVENPEAGFGAVVPTWEFSAFRVEPNTRASIYVRMNGPFIDNTVDPNKNEGDLAYDGDDLRVFAGWYVRPEDPKFPTAQTTDPAPIFAGKFYYDLALDCNEVPPIQTSIVFNLALSRRPVTEYSLLENAAYKTFESLLQNDAVLKGMVKDYGLVQVQEGVEVLLDNYNGECASTWDSCDSIRTTMKFEHSPTLDSGEVEERMYRHFRAVSSEQLKFMPEGTEAAYVGFVDASANFELSLAGVSEADEMDEAQIKYLQDQIREHINRRILQTVSRVTTVYVNEQKLFDSDSIEVRGVVNGVVIAVETTSDFALRVKNALKAFDKRFLEQLKFNLNYPGPITEDKRYQYFIGASELTGVEVIASDLTRAPTPAPTFGDDIISKGKEAIKDNFDSSYFGYIGAAVGGMALLIILCCFCKHMAKSKKLAQEREERKAERRARTLLKEQSEEEPVVFPTKSFGKQSKRDVTDDEEEDEEKPVPRTIQRPQSRRQFADTDSYDPSSIASHSDVFLDEGSLGDDSANVRLVANIYSLGGYKGVSATPARKPRVPPKEPNAPHSESEEAKELLKKDVPIIYQHPQSTPGDLESTALSGDLFGGDAFVGGGAGPVTTNYRNGNDGAAAASASQDSSPKCDGINSVDSSEHSHGDEMTESSKTKKKKKRSKSMGGSSSLPGDGNESFRSHKSRSKSTSKTTSDIEDDVSSKRHHKSSKSSRRRSSRAASGEDHSDRQYDDDNDNDESEHSVSHRSHKSKKSSSKRSSKKNVFIDPVFDDEEPKKAPASDFDLD